MSLPKPRCRYTRIFPKYFWMIVLAAAATARGDDGKTLSVTGMGTVRVRPDVLELDGIVIGQAELAADALKQLRDNRRRAEETIQNLKIDGLKFRSSQRNVNSPNSAQQAQMILSGQEGETPLVSHVVFHEKVILRLEGIDKLNREQLSESLVKIIDAAKDAALIVGSASSAYSYANMGVDFDFSNNYGNNSMLRFRVMQSEAASQKALELAAKDARTKADRLAALLGVKVGKVRSASETATSDDSTTQFYGAIAQLYGAASSTAGSENGEKANEAAGDGNPEEIRAIPFSAALHVVYDIVD